MSSIEEIFENEQLNHLIGTVAWLGGLLVLRWVLLRRITRLSIRSSDLRRRWIVQIRNAIFLLLTLGLIVIWAEELRTLAISVVAIFAAIVLATKELIQCVTGGIFKITTKAFSLGDRIVVNNLRGDVIDQTLLATKILEIGPGTTTYQGTSRAVTIPNSLFLTTPIYNESFTEEYGLHTFTIPLTKDDDWERSERFLLEAAGEVCRSFVEDARRHIAHLTAREGFDTPSVDPRVSLSLPEPARVDLIVRVPAQIQRKGRIEQEILRRYLRKIAQHAKSQVAPEKSSGTD